MLKFIPQNKNNYEKSAKEELGISSDFLEFFSSDSKEISEKINSTLSEIKSSKRGEIFYNKILYYFSFLENSGKFKDDDKGKKVIKNLIEICEPEVGTKIYQDLFYILTEEKNNLPLKKEILKQIPKSKLNLEECDFILLYNLFILYLLDTNFDNEIMIIFAELTEKNKNYILLKQLENIEKIKIIIRNEYLKNKENITKNAPISKLFFFLIMVSQDLVDEDLEQIKLNEKLVEEKKMFDNLENRKDDQILFNSDNQKYFEETYGEKAAEFILMGAKESCIHEILNGFDEDKQNKISFKDFIQKVYEEDDEETEKKDLTDEEVERLEEKMYKKKKMFLGVIVFTTELYKQFLVPTVVVIDGCIKPLLKRIFTKEFSFVEPLSKLLMNVGEQLETDSKYKDILDSIYDSLSEIKKDPEMSKRDQFMIQDILELREGWRRAARRSKMTSSKPPAPVVRTITLTPPKAANIDSVRQLIISTLDEFMSSNDREAAFDYFRREVTSTTFGYVLMPQMIRYIFNNALPEKDVEKIASLLCDYPEFKRSDPKVFDQAMDDLLEVLADVEDATDKVISSFAVFMSMILKHLNYSITQSFIGCLTKLLDYDPFCSSKEKKRFGVPALYFVSTLSMVRKLDLEGEIVMKSKAEGYEKLFLSDEDRKALFEMYGI